MAQYPPLRACVRRLVARDISVLKIAGPEQAVENAVDGDYQNST